MTSDIEDRSLEQQQDKNDKVHSEMARGIKNQ